MDYMLDLIELWAERPFTGHEIVLADTVAYSALRALHLEAKGNIAGLPALLPDPAGTFERVMDFMKLSPDQMRSALAALGTQMERNGKKQTKNRRGKRSWAMVNKERSRGGVGC